MNDALLYATSATGDEVLCDEYPTPVAARRAGRKLVETREAEYFRVYRRARTEDGTTALVREPPDTAHGFPPPRAFRASLRVGMRGLCIPGRVGRWRVTGRYAASHKGEDVELFSVLSESFTRCARVPELLVDERRAVICDIISDDLRVAAEKEGYNIR